MSNKKATLFYLLCCFCLGILAGKYGLLPHQWSWYGVILFGLLFSLSYFIKSRSKQLSLLIYPFFICIGITSISFQQAQQPNNFNLEPGLYTIKEDCRKSANSFKTIVEDSKQQKAIIYSKDRNFQSLKSGDQVEINLKISKFQDAINPEMFSYKEYLSKKNILFSAFLTKDNWKLHSRSDNFNLKSWALKAQKKIATIILGEEKTKPSYPIAYALLFGDKTGLSIDQRSAFQDSGAMHILAVSGLHTGIVYLLLFSIFQLLPYRIRNKKIEVIVIIVAIWMFALLTGLKAPVCRAALMLSFLEVGKLFSRRTNSLTALSASAFILLIINPLDLWDPGFQLSFGAVLSIIYFFDDIKKLLTFKNKLGQQIWSLTALSLAAQIGTLPFVIYYFHQFPIYFFLSNLILIPLAYIFYSTAILTLISVPILAVASDFFHSLVLGIAKWIGIASEFIQSLPFSIIDGIYIKQFELILLLFGSIFAAFYFFKKKKLMLWPALICFLALFSFSLLESNHHQQQKGWAALKLEKQMALALIEGAECILIVDSSSLSPTEFNYYLKPFFDSRHIENLTFKNIPGKGFNFPPWDINITQSDAGQIDFAAIDGPMEERSNISFIVHYRDSRNSSPMEHIVSKNGAIVNWQEE